MPKFIGNDIEGSTQIQNNARQTPERVRIQYSQAILLPPSAVLCSLDTSDRGGPKTMAKRWFRWFASPSDILACEKSTENMRSRATAV